MRRGLFLPLLAVVGGWLDSAAMHQPDGEEGDQYNYQQTDHAENERHVGFMDQGVAAMRTSLRLLRHRLQAAMANLRASLRYWFVHRLWGQYSIPHPPAKLECAPPVRPLPRNGYNRGVRLISSLFLILCLAACQHGGQNNTDAVRQGVIDYLAKSGFNIAGMDVKITSVEFKGGQADMAVGVTPKGQSSVPPMPFSYHLERQNNKWVVVGHSNNAGHGAEAAPGAGGANPHGGAMPPAMPGGDNPHGGGSKMPSPEDLPPAKK